MTDLSRWLSGSDTNGHRYRVCLRIPERCQRSRKLALAVHHFPSPNHKVAFGSSAIPPGWDVEVASEPVVSLRSTTG